MDSILFWGGALVVVSILSPLLKYVIAMTAGRKVGEMALAGQPDTIHLVAAGPGAWKNANPPRRLVDSLAGVGFVDAGVHSVPEMPGVIVQVLAHPGEGFYAAVYEHPAVGHWIDLVCKFQDGTSITWTTSKPTGLDPRPGHPMVNLPGMDPTLVYEKARATRPRRPVEPASIAYAVNAFETGYAESIAYRKGVGVSNREATKVAGAQLAA